jgi:phage/plasmid-like protein (TIGR03299 family)
MAHNLTITPLGHAEMFYVRESPWHGLGTRLEQVASSRDALDAARLRWQVHLEPIRLASGEELTDHRATVRSDTKTPLGVVGRRYLPIQNEMAFAFLDDLVGQATAMFHTAGSLHGGRKVWALVKLPVDLIIVPQDRAGKYLLLVNSHDGTSSLTCRFVATRVVCENTLLAALREQGVTQQVAIRHTRNATARVQEARRVLGIGVRYFDVLGRRCEAMAGKQLTQRMLTEYFRAVVPFARTGDVAATKRTERIHEALALLFEKGRGNHLSGVRGSLWAAYNAVTEYTDHVRGVRKDGPRATWLDSSAFGDGARLNRRAFAAATALLDEGTLGRFWRRVRSRSLIGDSWESGPDTN